jgi:hypothetical protein
MPRLRPRLSSQLTIGSKTAKTASPMPNMKITDHERVRMVSPTTPAMISNQNGALGADIGRNRAFLAVATSAAVSTACVSAGTA